MTTVEATALLFEWFGENDSFTILKKPKLSAGEDFKKLIKISADEQADLAAVIAGLQAFTTEGLIRQVEVDTRTIWVLEKPIAQYNQTVKINHLLAKTISVVVNKFCEATNDKTDLCNPAEIKEKDIQNLCLISSYLAGELQKAKEIQ